MAPLIRGTRLVHEGWARYLVAEVMQDDGTRITREIEDHGRAVAVLPYDPDRRVAALVSQFRAAVLYAGGPPSHARGAGRAPRRGRARGGRRREAMRGDRRRLSRARARRQRLERCRASPPSGWTCFSPPYGAADRTGPGGGLAAEGEAIAVHEIPLPELAAHEPAAGAHRHEDTGRCSSPCDCATRTCSRRLRLAAPADESRSWVTMRDEPPGLHEVAAEQPARRLQEAERAIRDRALQHHRRP